MRGFGRDLFFLVLEEEAMEGPWVFPSRQQEVSRRSRDVASAAVEFPMLHNEIRRHPVTDKIACATGMIHSDREILMHLEVKVRGVHSMIVPDGADLLTSFYLLSLPHHDPIEMTVERVCKVDFSVRNPGMSDHHHISPISPDITR